MTIPLFDCFALRPLRPDDSGDIFRTIDSQRGYLGQWLPFVALTRSEEDSRAFIAASLGDPANPVYTLRAGSLFAGLIGFKSADPACGSIEIGYWLRGRAGAPPHRVRRTRHAPDRNPLRHRQSPEQPHSPTARHAARPRGETSRIALLRGADRPQRLRRGEINPTPSPSPILRVGPRPAKARQPPIVRRSYQRETYAPGFVRSSARQIPTHAHKKNGPAEAGAVLLLGCLVRSYL